MCKYILYIYNIYIYAYIHVRIPVNPQLERHTVNWTAIRQDRIGMYSPLSTAIGTKKMRFQSGKQQRWYIYIYIVGFYYILLFYLLGTICSIYLLLPTKLQFLNQTSGPIPARSQGVRSPWFRDELQHTVQTTTAMATESMVMPMSCGAGRAADNFQASLSSGNFGMVAMGKRKRNKLSRQETPNSAQLGF